MLKILVLVLLAGGLSGCTWVKLSDDGMNVSLKKQDQVESCKRLGNTTSVTRAKVAGIIRDGLKVKSELQTLARNEAARMGGNTIVVVDENTPGQADFIVYRCDG